MVGFNQTLCGPANTRIKSYIVFKSDISCCPPRFQYPTNQVWSDFDHFVPTFWIVGWKSRKSAKNIFVYYGFVTGYWFRAFALDSKLSQVHPNPFQMDPNPFQWTPIHSNWPKQNLGQIKNRPLSTKCCPRQHCGTQGTHTAGEMSDLTCDVWINTADCTNEYHKRRSSSYDISERPIDHSKFRIRIRASKFRNQTAS